MGGHPLINDNDVLLVASRDEIALPPPDVWIWLADHLDSDVRSDLSLSVSCLYVSPSILSPSGGRVHPRRRGSPSRPSRTFRALAAASLGHPHQTPTVYYSAKFPRLLQSETTFRRRTKCDLYRPRRRAWGPRKRQIHVFRPIEALFLMSIA